MKDFNDKGYRIGQKHHRAKLTNRDVELILQLRGEGYTLKFIAKKMECGKSTVWQICQGITRAQTVVR